MSENKRKLRDGCLFSFEEVIMTSVKDKVNYQRKLDDFTAKQSALGGKKSEVQLCWKCNGTEVLYQEAQLPLITNNKRFKSAKLIAAICSNCGEKYYDRKEMKQLEEIDKIINSYSCEGNNAVEPSVSYCEVCESDNIDNVELEVYLLSKDSKIISVTIQEDYCTRCNAVYFADEGDQMAIDHLKIFLLTQ
ncbi:hypothetical protein [Paenibacillus sp. FSL M8-0142]|uniref:hypothetical protein n=1 Tax=Paenibacillus sp. FSL M8-0142 TaxID=2954525 RepID=UPI00315A15E0